MNGTLTFDTLAFIGEIDRRRADVSPPLSVPGLFFTLAIFL